MLRPVVSNDVSKQRTTTTHCFISERHSIGTTDDSFFPCKSNFSRIDMSQTCNDRPVL